jgi:hypothetical protein
MMLPDVANASKLAAGIGHLSVHLIYYLQERMSKRNKIVYN